MFYNNSYFCRVFEKETLIYKTGFSDNQLTVKYLHPVKLLIFLSITNSKTHI